MKKHILPTKKKLIELGLLLGINCVLFFIWPSLEAIILFTYGFIWNWTASQNLDLILDNKRYRFSMLKMVHNLQVLILKPFKRLPEFVKVIPRILPAGLFWGLVVVFTDSDMPWTITFLGSFVFELTQIESYFKKTPPLEETPS